MRRRAVILPGAMAWLRLSDAGSGCIHDNQQGFGGMGQIAKAVPAFDWSQRLVSGWASTGESGDHRGVHANLLTDVIEHNPRAGSREPAALICHRISVSRLCTEAVYEQGPVSHVVLGADNAFGGARRRNSPGYGVWLYGAKLSNRLDALVSTPWSRRPGLGALVWALTELFLRGEGPGAAFFELARRDLARSQGDT